MRLPTHSPSTTAEIAFAGHYDFDIDVLAAYRPTGKGRVERQVDIVRDHVLAGRAVRDDRRFRQGLRLSKARITRHLRTTTFHSSPTSTRAR
jgi:hypothetical protein